MISLRCSSLPRIAVCPAAAIPPELVIDTSDAAGDLGSALHEVMASCVNMDAHVGQDAWVVARKWRVDGGDVSDLLDSAWHRIWRGGHVLSRYFPSVPKTEQEMQHTFGEVELTGHADVVGPMSEGNTSGVIDWKTGWKDADYSEQLRGYAWLTMHTYGVRRVYAAIGWVRTGDVEGEWYTYSELEVWWQRLVARLSAERPSYSTGPHCTYCPRAVECPAKRAYLNSGIMSLDTFSDRDKWPPLETLPASYYDMANVLAAVIDRVGMIDKLLDKVRDAVRAEVSLHPGGLKTTDGRRLEVVEQVKEVIDAKAAWKELLSLLGDDLPDCVAVSKTKVGEIVMAQQPRGSKGAAVKAVWDRLRDLGALKASSVHKLEIRRALPQVEGGGN